VGPIWSGLVDPVLLLWPLYLPGPDSGFTENLVRETPMTSTDAASLNC